MWKTADGIGEGMNERSSSDMISTRGVTTNESKTGRVKVRIIRPNGTYRDVTVAGHFREEHLCSLVDDELCRLGDDEALIVHLFHVDSELSRSLRDRWDEGLSDNRRVFVREVLGPTEDPRQIAVQLRHVSHRLANGERVNLAIRSPHVAQLARQQLRKMLLVSQRSEQPKLHVWVHGDDEQQNRILTQLESIGVVRARDYEQFVRQHPEQRWRAPWIEFEAVQSPAKQRHRHRHHHKPQRSNQDAVQKWIRRVEQQREQRHQPHAN